MKPVRLALIGGAGLFVVLLVAVVVAFNSSFQTWAARRAIAKNPALHVTLGKIDAGLKRVEVRDVRFEQNGAILTLPQIEADLPVISAGMNRRLVVSRLVAKGWTLDLSKTSGDPAPSANPAAVAPATVAIAARQAFAGVFGGLELPVELSLDGVQLEGEVILPESRGRTRFTLTGGGLGAGRDGKFDLAGDATLTDEKVSKLAVRAVVVVAMDTPRTFRKLAADIDASASGTQFPNGVKLTAAIGATNEGSNEAYSLKVDAGGRSLLAIDARGTNLARVRRDASGDRVLNHTGQTWLRGNWTVDVRDSDVGPFVLGLPLPVFTVVGAGEFSREAAMMLLRAAGKVTATVDRLAAIRPELGAVGPLKVTADFDVEQSGDAISVHKLDAAIEGTQPVATVRTLQSFTIDPKTRELKASDSARELVNVVLQGLPLAWVQPLLKDTALGGGDLRGELVATTRSNGLSVRSTSPLVVNGFSLAQSGKPLLQDVALALTLTADYAPQGWQAEIGSLTAKSGNATLLTLEARAGQLAGKDQPLKATGKLSIDLPAWLAQPGGSGSLALIKGEVTADFVASVGLKQELQANVRVRNLAADPKVLAGTMPSLSTELRADIAPGGQITLSAPLLIERDGRKSDLVLAGTLTRARERLVLDAQVTSTNLVVEDAKMLAGLAPSGEKKPAAAGEAKAPSNAPPWAGVEGTLKLALKRVVYSENFEAANVAGTIRLEGGALKLEKLGAVTGDGGEARVDGAVTFDAKAPQPYALNADLVLKEFDPAPLFRAINPQQPPTVEGKFNVTSRISGRAATLAELPEHAAGDFQLASRGGMYRGIPVNVSNTAETTGRVAGWIASAGTAIGALTGKKEYSDIASKAQALAELASFLRAIAYDQLGVVVTRDPALNATLKEFTLISPEIRLTGTGTTIHRTGTSALEDAISMEFKLRARGRVADLLRYLDLLEPQVDNLGYAGSTVPLKVRGTVGKPDTSELNAWLATRLLEKSGVGEKAGDLFNRLIGGGK